jgi:hypothetical protein
VVGIELGYGEDILLPPGRLQGVLSMTLRPARWLVTATVTLENRGAATHEVDLWFSAIPPPSGGIVGPRASHAGIVAGSSITVPLGPVVAEVGNVIPISVQLLAQRDPSSPEDEVWVVEGTGVVNRAGATGMVALGGFDAPVGGDPPGGTSGRETQS